MFVSLHTLVVQSEPCPGRATPISSIKLYVYYITCRRPWVGCSQVTVRPVSEGPDVTIIDKQLILGTIRHSPSHSETVAEKEPHLLRRGAFNSPVAVGVDRIGL